MTAIIKTGNQKGRQEYNESKLPLAVAVTVEKEIVFGKEAELSPAGWFALADGRIFFQPLEGYSVKFNDSDLSDSTWLNDGDRISIESSIIEVSVESGLYILTYDSLTRAPALKPPAVYPVTDTGDNTAGLESGRAALPEDSENYGGSKSEGPSVSSGPPFFAPLSKKKSGSHLYRIMLGVFLLLVSGVLFVITALPVSIKINPTPDSISVSRFPLSLRVGERYLAFPGNYRIKAKKTGYRDLEREIRVRFGKEAIFNFDLVKLPGLLSIRTEPVRGAGVELDGIVLGVTPLESVEVEAGEHELAISSERYLPVVQTIDIKGMGKIQALDFTLKPGWGTLKVESEPEGAEVLLNGEKAGHTPLVTEPVKGVYEVELRKDGWMPLTMNTKIEPGDVIELEPVKLKKVRGMIVLKTEPSGASVLIDDKFEGYSPVSVAVTPEVEHDLKLTKSGFSPVDMKFKVLSGQKKDLDISLKQEYGVVFITSRPADARMKVDGKEMGGASRRLRLTAAPHTIEIFKEGYETYSKTVTPVKGVSGKLDVNLKKHNQHDDAPAEIKTAEGQLLLKVALTKPVQFRMGSSRREPGRRSNETQYTVELTRSFYISKKEVTNEEFQRFRKEHNSGSESGYSLNENNQPVTSVSWDDAAAYLNWLSEKDGLPPVYNEENGRMVAAVPTPSGYRLPTEAEWVFVARYQGGILSGDAPLKFPWGSERYPKEKSGNYADSSAQGLLPLTMTDYNDGYRVAAPVASFPADASGIYDLGGNVSEWCHDIYDIQSGFTSKILRDPEGPSSGKYHVVRGSSWRHGSITELRLSYRDYTDKGRKDLGFRIARYEDDKN